MHNRDLGKEFEFDATITYEMFFDDSTLWGAYAFETDQELPETKERPDPFGLEPSVYTSNLVGKTQRLDPSMKYHVKAKLAYSKKYKSYNYEIVSVQHEAPQSLEDQKTFLKTLVTERQAETLLNVYPNIVEMVLSGEYEVDLSLLDGIGKFTMQRIEEKILDNYLMADLMVLLAPIGVSLAKIKKIFSMETNPAVAKDMFLQNPYVITKLDRISFAQADKIAVKINPELEVSMERLMAFIEYFLVQLGENEGHTWTTIDTIRYGVLDFIPECEKLLDELIKFEKENPSFLYINNDKIGLNYYYNSEKEILEVVEMISCSSPLEISQEEINNGIKIAEEQQGFKFTEEQVEFLIQMTKNNFNIITGKAGSGKSTLLRGIVNIYGNKQIALCALSAKASKRIEETTGRTASTIHRLLGAMGENQFYYGSKTKLPYDVIIVDESSMVNAYIFHRLFLAVRSGSKVVLCGDSKQLPPIGYGNVFGDLLEKGNINVNRLTKILRQAEKSGIITDANKIRDGISPIEKPLRRIVHGENKDMYYMFRDDKAELRRIAIERYLDAVKDVGLDDVFILTPRKNTVINSSLEINKKIQDILINDDVPQVKLKDGRIYKQGCKVIHRVNDYDKQIFNGELGYIVEIKTDSIGEPTEIIVGYGENKISYAVHELYDIDYAYALTTHLYQGSEADTVIGIIDKSHYTLLDATFLYTMITRARSRCLLLAEPYAYKRCLKENKSINRQTWIKEL